MNNPNKQIFEIEKLKAMMEAATESLTGQKVVIRLRAPVVENFTAQVYKESDGSIAIDIKPNLDLETFYEAWLHETAHIHLGHCDSLEPRNYADFPCELLHLFTDGIPFLELNETEREAYKEDSRETDARMVANGLDTFAQNHAWYKYYVSDVETRIRVLTNYVLRKDANHE